MAAIGQFPFSVCASFTNQGDGGTCVSHSLGKAVVDGFQRGIFFPGKVVNINQQGMILVFLNVYKDTCGKDPRGNFGVEGKTSRLGIFPECFSCVRTKLMQMLKWMDYRYRSEGR